MRSERRFAAIVLALATTAALLVGCGRGGSDDATPDTTAGPPPAPVATGTWRTTTTRPKPSSTTTTTAARRPSTTTTRPRPTTTTTARPTLQPHPGCAVIYDSAIGAALASGDIPKDQAPGVVDALHQLAGTVPDLGADANYLAELVDAYGRSSLTGEKFVDSLSDEDKAHVLVAAGDISNWATRHCPRR